MSEQKPKRKRRTKAQIEADKKKQEAKQAQPKEGLGDKVEKIAKATGVKAFVEFMNGGEPCSGCEKRKERLNLLDAKIKNAQPITLDEYNLIESLQGRSNLKATEVIQLYKTHARVFNQRYVVPGNCASCVKKRLEQLTKLYKAYNHGE
jgi:hypothetical protein